MGASSSTDRSNSADHNSTIPSDSPPSMSDSASSPQTHIQSDNTEPQKQEANSEKPEQPKSKEEQEEEADGVVKSEEEEDSEEEERECGFCLFMKGGGCKESFTAWEKCIEEAENEKDDIAQKCFDLTSALRDCMLQHSDYYEPILKAEKAAEEEAVKELNKEKAMDELDKDKKNKEEEVVNEVENNPEPAQEVSVTG